MNTVILWLAIITGSNGQPAAVATELGPFPDQASCQSTVDAIQTGSSNARRMTYLYGICYQSKRVVIK